MLIVFNYSLAQEFHIGSEGYIYAGNVDYIGAGITPGISWTLPTQPGGGWMFGLDYFKPFKTGSARLASSDGRLSTYRRTSVSTLWLCRWADIEIVNRSIRVAAGLGWGYFATVLDDRHLYAGTIGYRVEALALPMPNRLPQLQTGFYFAGHPWLTSGYADDRFGITAKWRINKKDNKD